MAKTAAPPGAKALLRRYGHRLEAIRRDYEGKAADLRKEARRLESDYKVLARQFQKDVATLKRKGVLPPTVDARSARPTSSALSRALNDLGDLLTGRVRAVKVSPAVARKLRAEDVQVVRGRAILDPRYTVRKGDVVEKRPDDPGNLGGRVLRHIRLDLDYEEKLAGVFSRMGPDDYIGLNLTDIYGNKNFSRLFGADQFEEFLNYLEGGDSFTPRGMKSVALVRVRTPALRPYYEEMARRALARSRAKADARAVKRKAAARAAKAAGRDKISRSAALRKARKNGRGSKNYG